MCISDTAVFTVWVGDAAVFTVWVSDTAVFTACISETKVCVRETAVFLTVCVIDGFFHGVHKPDTSTWQSC